MPSQVLISIIIPTYNYASVIERALDSVLAQWADDLELVVVDDGSQDNTAQVLADYVNCHSQPIQVVYQENAGPAAARNRGIGLASGKYVLLLDADDELLPEAIGRLRRVLQDDPDVGMVLGGQLSFYPDGRERLRLPRPVTGTPLLRARRYLLEKRIAISHGSSLFRRDLLLQRPYPEELRGGEDIPVFAFMLVNARVALVNEPLVRIYKHADSLRHSRQDNAEYVAKMTREVFVSLPAECQSLRTRYEAQRHLSLFRAALLENDKDSAWKFYKKSVRLSLLQSLRPDYVRKFVKLLLSK